MSQVGAELGSIQEFLRERGFTLSSPEARGLIEKEFPERSGELSELFGSGPLETLLRDPSITEIVVNGPSEIWAERNGKLELERDLVFSGEEALKRWVRRILSVRGRKVDHCSPFADCTLECGSRVHVAAPPIARKGICLSIRKFPTAPWSLARLQENGAVSEKAASFLREAVVARRNIFISGGTGTGKTSLLGALLGEVDQRDRIVALEDIAEIKSMHPHLLSLEARPANQEGEGEINLHKLLRESLRMRPDRLVIGECRGPEALDLLLALNTGHAGSMGTIHANSPRDALQRIETLALLGTENLGEQALKNLILGGIHLIVQLERGEAGRKLAAISEVKGLDGGRFLLREVQL